MALKDEKVECGNCGWQGMASQAGSDGVSLAELCPECGVDDLKVVDEYTDY